MIFFFSQQIVQFEVRCSSCVQRLKEECKRLKHANFVRIMVQQRQRKESNINELPNL